MKGSSVRDIAVRADATLYETISVLDRSARQIVLVCDDGGRLLGTVTDGDIRRALLDGADLRGDSVTRVMQRRFHSVSPEAGRAEVLDVMRARGIAHLPVLDGAGRLLGVHTLKELMGSVERPNAALLMAGGKGTRLRPLTTSLPKPMVRVAGRPILERIVLHLVGFGIRELYLSINYLGHMVEEYFRDGSDFGCRIHYLREDAPLGTAGCLSLLPARPDEALLVMNGDLVTQADVGRLLDFHEKGGYHATLGVRPHVVDIPFGVAEVETDRLVDLQEKPQQRVLVNAGIYVLSPDVVERVPPDTPYLMTDLLRACLDRGEGVGAHLVEEDWVDVGRPEQLLLANGRL